MADVCMPVPVYTGEWHSVLAGMTAQPSLSAASRPRERSGSLLAVARAVSLASPGHHRALARQVVVRRLLALDEAGTLETVHVGIAAGTAGVSVRTVWRWLARAREGHVDPVCRRGGFCLDDVLWARLEQLGGNVAELHRELERAGDESSLEGRLPSLATMHRAVREQLRAGRLSEATRPRREHVDPDRYARALAELALPGTVDEAGRQMTAPPALEPDPATFSDPPAGPRMVAFLAGQQAHAAAQAGARTGALAHIKAAEVAMEKAESRAKALGSYNPSALHYHVGQVRYELGDIPGSIESMELADRFREPTHRRTRVRYNAMLAEWQWQAGRMEEAVATWDRVLEDYPHVRSGRCDDRVRILVSTGAPRTANALARDLHDRAKMLLPQ